MSFGEDEEGEVEIEEGESGEEEEDEEEEDAEGGTAEANPEKKFDLREEVTFEKICLNMLNQQNWNGLAIVSKKHLQKNHTSSWKAFFYYGIAMYK